MFTLPASGASVALRLPDGQDEMLLVERGDGILDSAIALLSRLGGEGFDAGALLVTDFETLLLRLRVARLGPALSLGFTCPHCRAVAEIGFKASDLIDTAQPRRPASVAADPDRPGWFRLADAGFRLPTARDQAEVADHPEPQRRLAELCLDAAARAPRLRTKVERVMEAMAPLLSREIAGRCPSCAAEVRTFLCVPDIVLRELKRAAAVVYEEIDLIARTYHWPEPVILSLPGGRRRAYAELIRRVPPRAAA
jgi:hypothetical protein